MTSFRSVGEKAFLINETIGRDPSDPDEGLEILETMEANLRTLSPETRRQYMSIARRFDDFASEFWPDSRPDYEQISSAVKLWFEELDLSSPSTIATYRSALSHYVSAAGFDIDLSKLVRSPPRSRANSQTIEPVDDLRLGRIRRETTATPSVRAAIELALSGLSLQEIVAVRSEDFTVRGLQVGMILTGEDSHQVEIFDPVSVRFLDQHRELLPLSGAISVERLRHRIAAVLWRHARLRGGIRCLRLTGIRRAVAMGISRKRIADSLQQKPPRSWEEFRRHKSRMPNNLYEPAPADPARARSIAEMSEVEFEQYLDRLGLDD